MVAVAIYCFFQKSYVKLRYRLEKGNTKAQNKKDKKISKKTDGNLIVVSCSRKGL